MTKVNKPLREEEHEPEFAGAAELSPDDEARAIEEVMGELQKMRSEFHGEPETAPESAPSEIESEGDVMDVHNTTGSEPEATEDSPSLSSESLSLKLSGSISLQLEYESHGQVVSLQFHRSALYLRLQDGTEFKVPLRGKGRLRSVA